MRQFILIMLSAMTLMVSNSLAQAATIVYVSNAESNDILVFQLNRQTGKLTKPKDYVMGKAPIWIEIVDLPAC